jgi:hypothetical protein
LGISPLPVARVDEKDDGIDGGKIIPPHLKYKKKVLQEKLLLNVIEIDANGRDRGNS